MNTLADGPAQTPRMPVRRAKLSELHADPANARQHDEKNLSAIAASLKQFGQVEPLVVQKSTGKVIGGNGRMEVLRRAGETEVDIVEVDVDDTRAAALGIALNRTGELAAWDDQALAKLLESLPDADFAVTGFSDDDLADLLDSLAPVQVEEDDAPEPPAEAVTRPGDVWLLGKHRVLCGDSTKPPSVQRLFGPERAAMCFTDPPWNVAIGTDSNPRHRQRPGLRNDDLSAEDFGAFLTGFIAAMAPVLDGDLYCVLGASEWPALDRCLRDLGFHWSATVIWAKDAFVLGRSKYHRRYEPLWYGWHQQGASSYCAGRDQDDVWEIPRPRRSEEHPTMKPVALPARAIVNSSTRGGIVYDAFLGAGSSLMAAEQLGRRCYGIELEPRFVDVIVMRWQDQTGRAAVLEGDGRSFEGVSAERLTHEKDPGAAGVEGAG